MKHLNIFNTFIFLFLINISLNAEAWWDNNWNHKVPITVSNTSATTVNNYEIKFDINATNSPNFVWANNGEDIRFVDNDDLTLLNHFLEDYDAVAMVATVWVNVPTITAMGTHDVNLYYDNPVATSSSDAANTFSQTGIKYHTKNSTFDPANQSSAESTFDATADGVAGYGCTHFTNYNSISNRNRFGVVGSNNMNIIYTSELFFNASTATTWQFRFGGDSGNGGSIYVDNTVIEELWDPAGLADDMWWGFSWAGYTTSQEILFGSQVISTGYHVLRYIGYEACCDGGATLQYSTDNGVTWLNFDTANLSIVSPQCPVNTVSLSFGAEETFDVTIAYLKSSVNDNYLTIEWTSETESFNIGYNIWSQNKSGHWHQINKKLIPSKKIHSLSPIDYFYSIKLKETIQRLQISSLNTSGYEDFYISHQINSTYGIKPNVNKTDWKAIQEENLQLSKSRQSTQRKTTEPSAAINLFSNQTGLMRITASELIPYGLNLADHQNTDIAVTLKGNPVARNIQTDTFTGEKYIDYFVHELSPYDALYLKDSVYQISINSSLVRVISPTTTTNPTTQTTDYQEHLQRNQNHLYSFASTSDDPWFEKLLYNSGSGTSYTVDFLLDGNIDLQQTFILNLKFLGLTNFPGDPLLNPDHHLKISINQHEIYNEYADGLFTWDILQQIDGNLLFHGNNLLTFELISDTGFIADLVYFDKMQLSFSKPLKTSNNTLDFNNDQNNTQFKFSGFTATNLIAYAENSNGDLYQLSTPDNQNTANNLFSNGFEIDTGNYILVDGINSNGINHYWVSSEENSLRPTMLKPSYDLPVNTESSDYLIISHPNFINSSLLSFKAAKQSQGYTTEIINWLNIVDQYGHGFATPEVLQSFLSHRFKQHPFKYVLLVGGQTYDYHDYLNNGSISFIPTNYRSTGAQINYTPSDFPYADTNNNGKPEFALGRWPVRTQQELNNIVNKTIVWQQTHPKPDYKTLLIAEQIDSNNTDFLQQANEIAIVLNLNSESVSRVFIDDYIGANTIDPITSARTDIINLVDNGIDNIIFDGHGSPTSWAKSGIVKAQHIQLFNNHNHPALLSPLSCYTTYYESPSTNTLAHQWLLSGENGAVAIHGAMVLGFYQSNQRMVVDILNSMNNEGKTIGEAILSIKKQLNPNSQLMNNWNLLGDPSLKL